jgi:hypothetical protein
MLDSRVVLDGGDSGAKLAYFTPGSPYAVKVKPLPTTAEGKIHRAREEIFRAS